MSATQVEVPFGDRHLIVPFAPGWNLKAVCRPAEVPAVDDAAAACRAALDAPLEMPPLAELARGKKRVAIVVEDISRPTSVISFFGPIVAALTRAGVPDDCVTMVTALGVHRPMTEDEMRGKVGDQAVARYRWINHRFDSPEHLDYLGKTTRGTPVYINRVVARADLVIGVGCVEPHIIASFGGGAKILVPGVAGRLTVAGTHGRNTTPATYNNVGLDPEKNPMRCDLEECVDMVAPPIFVVDAVLRGDLRIAAILAGDRRAVYRAGCRAAADIFGAHVPGPADVVIASSHPMNFDMRQGVKALANTIRALRPGGTMLCLMVASEGAGDMPLPKKRLPLGQRRLKYLARMLLPMLRFTKFGMAEEAHFFIYFALQAVRQFNVIFYAPHLDPELHRRVPMLEFHADLDAALASAARATPRGDVVVFPNGGVTYPILP